MDEHGKPVQTTQVDGAWITGDSFKGLHIMHFEKPSWIKRVLVKWLLGWTYIDYKTKSTE